MKNPARRRVRHLILFVSFFLFPWSVNWLSPYLSIGAAWSGAIGGSVLLFALMFLLAPVFGRGFCSWLCPGGFAQDTLAAVRGKRPGSHKIWRVKWFVWTPWFAALVSGLVYAGVHSVDPTWSPGGGRNDFLSSVGAGTLMSGMVTFGFVAFALIGGRRAACHTVCWMAPFMILGRKLGRAAHIPGFKLVADTRSCNSCGTCNSACPMGIAVRENVAAANMEHRECILCADCVDSCPKSVIRISFGR